MGNSTSPFPYYSWQHISNRDNYSIERDQKTGIHSEKHIIPYNPKTSLEELMEIYRYRNLSNKPIVKVYDAELEKGNGQGVCGADKNIIVHSEFIPYRLSNVRKLGHGQALYVLSESLSGFNELHYRFGNFEIFDDLVGFNEIGQVKVWHSPNFANNHLRRDSIILMSTKNVNNYDERMERRIEEEMVEDIWEIVDRHANISENFRVRANCFRRMNFIEARNMVAEEIRRGEDYVPEFLNLQGIRGSHEVRETKILDLDEAKFMKSRQFEQNMNAYTSDSVNHNIYNPILSQTHLSSPRQSFNNIPALSPQMVVHNNFHDPIFNVNSEEKRIIRFEGPHQIRREPNVEAYRENIMY